MEIHQISDAFGITNGLKQGGVLSPIFFNIFFGAIINAARKEFKEKDLGVKVTTRLRGGMLSSMTRAEKAVFTCPNVITDIEFADDCELCANSEGDIQDMLNIMHRITTAFGQTINVKKTKVIIVQSSATAKKNPTKEKITVGDEEVETVSSFRYLGSVESERGTMDEEVSRRRQNMFGAFHRLRSVFTDTKLSVYTRLLLFNAIVVPNGVYGSQAWNLSKKNIAKLESVYFSILRRILGIKYSRTPLVRILELARRHNPQICPIECRLRQCQLRYFGHVSRKGMQDPTKMVAYSFGDGEEKVGRPFLDFKDTLKSALEMFGISCNTWEILARTSNKKTWAKHLTKSMDKSVDFWIAGRKERDAVQEMEDVDWAGIGESVLMQMSRGHQICEVDVHEEQTVGNVTRPNAVSNFTAFSADIEEVFEGVEEAEINWRIAECFGCGSVSDVEHDTGDASDADSSSGFYDDDEVDMNAYMGEEEQNNMEGAEDSEVPLWGKRHE